LTQIVVVPAPPSDCFLRHAARADVVGLRNDVIDTTGNR